MAVGATPQVLLPLALTLTPSHPYPYPIPKPNPTPNPTLTRWALRGNFWFDKIKATETPMCVDDELMRRSAHTAHMLAMRRAAGRIALDARRQKEQRQSVTNEPLPGQTFPTSSDMAEVARTVAIKRRQARS